jgi:hypothetical protein
MVNIFDESNEEYLKKIIEADEKQETEKETILEKIVAPYVEKDIRQEHGHKSISLDLLPSRGIFYPSDLVVTASSLKVKDVRHFSSIDETDDIDISDKINFVINTAVKTQSSTGFTPKCLLEVDRFYLLFLIRDLTFIEYPSNLYIDAECKECGEKDTVDIRLNRLGVIREGILDDYMNKYSNEKRCISLEAGKEVIDLYFPSIHNLETARKMIKDETIPASEQDKFMMCFLVSPHIKLSKQDFDRFSLEIDEWSPVKYALVKGFIDKVNSSYSLSLFYKCSGCGAGVTAPLRFQRGLKELFIPDFSDSLR